MEVSSWVGLLLRVAFLLFSSIYFFCCRIFNKIINYRILLSVSDETIIPYGYVYFALEFHKKIKICYSWKNMGFL